MTSLVKIGDVFKIITSRKIFSLQSKEITLPCYFIHFGVGYQVKLTFESAGPHLIA